MRMSEKKYSMKINKTHESFSFYKKWVPNSGLGRLLRIKVSATNSNFLVHIIFATWWSKPLLFTNYDIGARKSSKLEISKVFTTRLQRQLTIRALASVNFPLNYPAIFCFFLSTFSSFLCYVPFSIFSILNFLSSN